MRKTKPDISLAIKTGHFNLLTTAVDLECGNSLPLSLAQSADKSAHSKGLTASARFWLNA
jgi:hypothetical protein